MKYPEKVLQFQKAFYFKINWRIEPVSMEKELKNTRWMGGIMIILALASFLIIAFWKHKPFDIAFLFR